MNSANRLAWVSSLLAASLFVSGCAGTSMAKPSAVPAKPVAVRATGNVAKVKPEFPGFRRVVRNNSESFCQTATPTGSRTRRGEQCYTRDELKRMEQNNRDMFKDAAGGSSSDSLKMDSPR
jgi:hypothetical protein